MRLQGKDYLVFPRQGESSPTKIREGDGDSRMADKRIFSALPIRVRCPMGFDMRPATLDCGYP